MRFFKLHTATEHGGNVEHFEVRDDREMDHFKREVFYAFIEAGAQHKRRNWLGFVVCSKWWKTHRAKDDDELPRTTRVVGVYELIDGEWVNLHPEFHEPALLWHRQPDPAREGHYIATEVL